MSEAKLPQICGIQQIGIGIPNVYEAFEFYRKNLGMDLPVFDEAAEAGLMLPYTEGKPRSRHAILAMNMMGGGGLEIWQYTSRIPQGPNFEVKLGDLGINIAKFKSPDPSHSHIEMNRFGLDIQSEVATKPHNQSHFFLKDPNENILEVCQSKNWNRTGLFHTGGIFGATIGVSDIEKSIHFYKTILGYDAIVSDKTGQFDDFKELPGGSQTFRRVRLKHRNERKGPFSQLLGETEIELIQVLDRTPLKIFKDRMWGDLGYIHLCFDVVGMEEMKILCTKEGHPFTVDSADSFDMGEAAGRFSYIEDPDGTLIEFVETHKIPIMKKWGWYLNLLKRDRLKPLSGWLLRAMALNRVKKPVA